MTARAFGFTAPRARGGSIHERLSQYARFTRDRAEEALSAGRDPDILQEALYREARKLGGRYRRLLGIRTVEEALEAARLLYRCIGIELCYETNGSIRIPRCGFSPVYTPGVCTVVSSLDRGLLAGLTGGWELRFGERITEGAAACTARLLPGEGVIL